ncbi:SGNH/GDSL hydrolase family protein [Streptomyces sp. NPDC102364]|uniref:SGNH/GDSL hydrolase family protein n=1 Tax=Streptomyces sp. NPDC102364 TaxID=3366161 RepID=UPI003806FFA7
MDREDASPFVRGVLPSWVREGSRLPGELCRKLPMDTVRAARIAAGVHLAFRGSVTAVELALTLGQKTTVPAPAAPHALVVRRGARTPSVRVLLPALPGECVVHVPLPDRAPDEVVKVYLPETVEVRVDGVVAVGGTLEPGSPQPLWAVYGDSITQGWSASEPGLAWPSLVAERLGLDLVNLAFAGAARGEVLAADAVAASGAAAVAIAWGTNAWSSLPTDADAVAQTTRLFLTAVRQGLPQVPLVVVSPLLRPDAERKKNRFGATHAEMRTAMEAAVRDFARINGDAQLRLVPGADLVPTDELADGLHPGDTGHRSLADAVAPAVAEGLGLVATAPDGRHGGTATRHATSHP